MMKLRGSMLRQNCLDPEGASEADLKKQTLTNLYNQRPTWLQHAHAALHCIVWAAYGGAILTLQRWTRTRSRLACWRSIWSEPELLDVYQNRALL